MMLITKKYSFRVMLVLLLLITSLLFLLCACNSEENANTNGTSSDNLIIDSNDNIEMKEYELNDIKFSLPSSWILDSNQEKSMTFNIDNEDGIAYVRSETITDIMKIDVGESSITTKTDVVNYYSVSKMLDCEIDNIEWIENNDFEYCKTTFSNFERNGKNDELGVSITIPININEAVFDITIISPNKNDLIIIDTIVDGIRIENNTVSTTGIAEKTYRDAITATKADLTKSNGKYYYKGIPLLTDDCEWIDNPINQNGTVNQGAVYRKIAKVLWGSDWENKRFLYSYKDIADLLLGFTPETVDDYVPLGMNASEFIVEKDQLEAIMIKFEKMNSVQGDFDFDYGKFGKFNIEIADLSSCAKEMQISDEMLGYIFAMLDEYGTKITFDGNYCHIEYTSYK